MAAANSYVDSESDFDSDQNEREAPLFDKSLDNKIFIGITTKMNATINRRRYDYISLLFKVGCTVRYK